MVRRLLVGTLIAVGLLTSSATILALDRSTALPTGPVTGSTSGAGSQLPRPDGPRPEPAAAGDAGAGASGGWSGSASALWAGNAGPESVEAQQARLALVQLINVERQQRGLTPVELAHDLSQAAEVRAGEIAERFSHDRPRGDILGLMAEVGARPAVVGENLARVDAPTPPVQLTHEMLMASDTHRDVLLSPRFSYVGVAASQTNGRWHIVELFAG